MMPEMPKGWSRRHTEKRLSKHITVYSVDSSTATFLDQAFRLGLKFLRIRGLIHCHYFRAELPSHHRCVVDLQQVKLLFSISHLGQELRLRLTLLPSEHSSFHQHSAREVTRFATLLDRGFEASGPKSKETLDTYRFRPSSGKSGNDCRKIGHAPQNRISELFIQLFGLFLVFQERPNTEEREFSCF